MIKLVTIGRGGTGKTSFVALMTKYLIEKGEGPLLLVDADPDQNLGEMLGIDLKEQGKKSISELIVETFIEGKGTTVGIPPSERMESKIWEKGMYEGDYFDFIAIGVKWVEGCYCLPNAALKGYGNPNEKLQVHFNRLASRTGTPKQENNSSNRRHIRHNRPF